MIKNNLITLQVRRKQSKTECKMDIFMSISRNRHEYIHLTLCFCLFPEINSQRLDFRFQMSYLYRVNDKVVSIKLHAKEGIAILSFLFIHPEKTSPRPGFSLPFPGD